MGSDVKDSVVIMIITGNNYHLLFLSEEWSCVPLNNRNSYFSLQACKFPHITTFNQTMG